MSLFLSILICYGITLLIVQAKIFGPFKKFISIKIQNFEEYLYPNDIVIGNLVLNNSSEIDQKHINVYKDILNKIEKNEDPKLLELLQDLQIKIKNNVIKNRENKLLTYILIKPVYKFLILFLDLINCMMCTGFWIGIFLCILSIFCNITIFGSLLSIVTTQEVFPIIASTILVGGLLSGTTWAINSIVDFFVELKDKLSSYIDSNMHKR